MLKYKIPQIVTLTRKWRLEITMELQKNVMKAFMICMITKKARYLRTFVLFVLDLNQGPSD